MIINPMMEPQFGQLSRPNARDPTLYCLCIAGSIIMFIMNVIYAMILLTFITDHKYDVLTEVMTVILTLLITFAIFIAIATLYTVTLNWDAYHDLKETYLTLAGLYLAGICLYPLWILVKSWGGDVKAAAEFSLIIWPAIGEYIVYLTVAYSFYNLYGAKMRYILVPASYPPQ